MIDAVHGGPFGFRKSMPGPAQMRTEVLSGLMVALALVPEVVAFAFVAGVHPLVGLYAAFIVGLITAIIGGRPGMISGATGALVVVSSRPRERFEAASRLSASARVW